MRHLYKVFFLIYGGLHLVGGVIIWLFPTFTGGFLNKPVPADSATLMGFLSMLAGLGFSSAAFATNKQAQKIVTIATILGNFLNFVAHFHNTVRGFMPSTILLFTVPFFLLIFVVLILLLRKIHN